MNKVLLLLFVSLFLLSACEKKTNTIFISPDNDSIEYMGRIDFSKSD